MNPVSQNVLYSPEGIGNGNCLTACLASILEIPLWMVPPFEQMFGRREWQTRVDEWLARMFNMKMVRYEAPGTSQEHDWLSLPEFYIANGPSSRGVYHSVIYSRGTLAHDPHFTGDGIQKVDWLWSLHSVEKEAQNGSE